MTLQKFSPKNPAMYARRNLLHAKSVGALAAAEAALTKLRKQKKPAKWVVKCFEAIEERMRPVADEMAKHRDEAW